jgi:hypothetical protein
MAAGRVQDYDYPANNQRVMPEILIKITKSTYTTFQQMTDFDEWWYNKL